MGSDGKRVQYPTTTSNVVYLRPPKQLNPAISRSMAAAFIIIGQDHQDHELVRMGKELLNRTDARFPIDSDREE